MERKERVRSKQATSLDITFKNTSTKFQFVRASRVLEGICLEKSRLRERIGHLSADFSAHLSARTTVANFASKEIVSSKQIFLTTNWILQALCWLYWHINDTTDSDSLSPSSAHPDPFYVYG